MWDLRWLQETLMNVISCDETRHSVSPRDIIVRTPKPLPPSVLSSVRTKLEPGTVDAWAAWAQTQITRNVPLVRAEMKVKTSLGEFAAVRAANAQLAAEDGDVDARRARP